MVDDSATAQVVDLVVHLGWAGHRLARWALSWIALDAVVWKLPVDETGPFTGAVDGLAVELGIERRGTGDTKGTFSEARNQL